MGFVAENDSQTNAENAAQTVESAGQNEKGVVETVVEAVVEAVGEVVSDVSTIVKGVVEELSGEEEGSANADNSETD